MKHLHHHFIIASLALGLGLVFVVGALTSVVGIPIDGWTPIRTFLSAMISSVVGAIMLYFGYHGVRSEILRPLKLRRRRS